MVKNDDKWRKLRKNAAAGDPQPKPETGNWKPEAEIGKNDEK